MLALNIITPPPGVLNQACNALSGPKPDFFLCVGVGGCQIGQILGPFMITRGLSCDRVGFCHFGGSDDSPDPSPLATGLLV